MDLRNNTTYCLRMNLTVFFFSETKDQFLKEFCGLFNYFLFIFLISSSCFAVKPSIIFAFCILIQWFSSVSRSQNFQAQISSQRKTFFLKILFPKVFLISSFNKNLQKKLLDWGNKVWAKFFFNSVKNLLSKSL